MPAKGEKWKDSKAKHLLREDIISGVVPGSMAAKDGCVYNMRPEYKKWSYKNFPTNLRNLCKAIADSYECILADCKAYGHDRALLLMTLQSGKNPQDIPWHKSEAKKLLKEQDIDDGKHQQMKPKVLHGIMREEYQTFPLKTF